MKFKDSTIHECVYVALRNRLETWALLEATTYSLRNKKGFHRTSIQPEFAVELLKSVDWALGWRGKKQWNDPVIADDIGGGDVKLWIIRLKIRKIIELVEEEKFGKANKMINEIKEFFLENSVIRFLECLKGETPQSGVSYRHLTNKIEMTDEMKKESNKNLKTATTFIEQRDNPNE